MDVAMSRVDIHVGETGEDAIPTVCTFRGGDDLNLAHNQGSCAHRARQRMIGSKSKFFTADYLISKAPT
jgi:hypothetical protein